MSEETKYVYFFGGGEADGRAVRAGLRRHDRRPALSV